jgi:lincosamide nucleotidyltransferase A/C/D/E
MSPLLRLAAIDSVRERLNDGRMGTSDVVEVLSRLQDAGVRAWLVGGWATDALLGRETRGHGDLDLVVDAATAAAARVTLQTAGFHVAHELHIGRFLRDQVVMIDGLRRPVALHPIDVDEWSAASGPRSIRQQARELGIGEIDDVFAMGRLGGHDVPSTSPASQLVLRCGYEQRDVDRRDVEALCRQFGLPSPRPYARRAPTPATDDSESSTRLSDS